MKDEICFKGIWLDKRKAFIYLDDRSADMLVVYSEIEEFNPIGGSRSPSAWGPVDTVSESKYLERFKHGEQRYFEALIKAVGEADFLMIMGPAQTKDHFRNFIDKKAKNQFKTVEVVSADSMTEGQLKARFRESREAIVQ